MNAPHGRVARQPITFLNAPIKMPFVRFNRLTKKKSTVRRRSRASTLTRAKYKPRTARANRSLIKSNALAIRAVKRMIPPPVYTDYQYASAYSPFTTGASGNFFNILSAELIEPPQWSEVLRQDANVLTASSTLLKRMQINLRYSLGQADWCQITTFVVSLRKDASNTIVNEENLVNDQDYIYSGQFFNPRLNSRVFKVHYVRNVSLMSSTWNEPQSEVGTTVIVGNPNTTWSKGQVNMTLNYRLRQPLGTPWNTMNQDQLPPHQRLYLLTFFRGRTSAPDNNPVRVDWDALYTCYNAS